MMGLFYATMLSIRAQWFKGVFGMDAENLRHPSKN
jgi:hypothetical protein